MTSLQDRVAIITGASSGIGEAMARELSEAGMRLVVAARRKERLDKLIAELPNAVAVVGDVLDPELPQKLIDTACSAFGRCDVVCNNAGFMTAGSIDDIDIELVCEMVRVNVESAFRLAFTAVRYFKQAGSGHLVNTSSVLGVKVRPSAGAYAGTKHAIEALSEDLRIELAGTGVKVTCIEPGMVMTELHNKFPVHPKDSMGIDKVLEPADIARCVRFVLEQPAHVSIPRLMVLPADQHI
jgi:NADP-dependent 3-hydroxy acid dehydrogenase YdfG